jgi:hypothetical protein
MSLSVHTSNLTDTIITDLNHEKTSSYSTDSIAKSTMISFNKKTKKLIYKFLICYYVA